jgi:hypothetical protein
VIIKIDNIIALSIGRLNMVKTVKISNEKEFKKLKSIGTTYHRERRIVVATTVGVYESADTDDVDSQRVNFVYEE